MTAGRPDPPAFRARDLGEQLDAAIKLTTREFGTLVRAVLVVVAPISLLGFAILAAAEPDDVSSSFVGGTTSSNAGFAVAQAAVAVLSGVVGLLASAACFRALAEAYLGRRVTWRESLRFAADRFGAIVWVTIIFAAGLVLAFICLVIPGLYFAIAWTLCYPVLLFEGLRGRRVLGRSRELVKGRWWSTFGAVFFGQVVAGFISTALGIALGVVVVVGLPDSGLAAIGVGQLTKALSQVISAPIQAAVLTVVFFDLKIRKEGFDLEMLADGLAGRDDGHPSALPDADRPPAATPGLGGAADPFGSQA